MNSLACALLFLLSSTCIVLQSVLSFIFLFVRKTHVSSFEYYQIICKKFHFHYDWSEWQFSCNLNYSYHFNFPFKKKKKLFSFLFFFFSVIWPSLPFYLPQDTCESFRWPKPILKIYFQLIKINIGKYFVGNLQTNHFRTKIK